MSYNLPPPPVLKTTIIQLNKDLDQDNGNFEILTNEYKSGRASSSSSSSLSVMNSQPAKKKRRRSNSNVNSEELAKRKFETKQLHSMIEKRRRIKINREFEALKYLIPACRLSKGEKNSGSGANNNSKIDGMYKLTILKSSVEYILYLHHLISKQSEVIQRFDPSFQFDLNFTKFPLDVNEYRNIDKDFSFKELIEDVEKELGGDSSHNHDNYGNGSNGFMNGHINFEKPETNDNSTNDSSSSKDNGSNEEEAFEDAEEEVEEEEFQLPSPLGTPDIQPNRFGYNSPFRLPDAALTLPRKKYFKSVPKKVVINEEISPMTRPQQPHVPVTLELIQENEENDASKTLLSLRKSSIDSLLN